MTDTTYNGWTNYETWNVSLLLDNEEGTYNGVRENVARIIEENRYDVNPDAPEEGTDFAASGQRHALPSGRIPQVIR